MCVCVCMSVYLCICWTAILSEVIVPIGLVGRMFDNDPGDLDSISGPVIPKTKKQKQYLMAPWLIIIIIIVVPPAQISLTISRHFSLSFIASGRSSGLHPVSSHSCCMYVRAGRPAFAWPYVGVHRSRSLTSSSLLLQQCPACLARLTCIVFVMRCKWPYSWRLVGCCRQDLFNIALNILV